MLFERKKYKSFARQQLNGRWTVPVLMTIIAGLILIVFSIPQTVEMIRSFPDIFEYDFSDVNSFSIFIKRVSELSLIHI